MRLKKRLLWLSFPLVVIAVRCIKKKVSTPTTSPTFTSEEEKFFQDLKRSLGSDASVAKKYQDLYEYNQMGFKMYQKIWDSLPLLKSQESSTEFYKFASRLYKLFWYTGRLKEASGIAKFLKRPEVDPQLQTLKALSNTAFFCYEWSEDATDASDQDLLDSIGRFMGKDLHSLRDQSLEFIPSGTVNIVEDQHGIARAFVSFVVPDDNAVRPKVYIVFTGTRNNVPCGQVLNQWIFTNLNFFPRKHPQGWSTHQGFQDMSDFLLIKILKLIDEKFPTKEDDSIEVIIKGHSMGAAIANIMSLDIGNLSWCHLCFVSTMATPCAFSGNVIIPKTTVIQNFLHKWDIVSISRPFYHGIGDTHILNDSFMLKSPFKIHSTFYPLFFHLFHFRSGEETIVETITYNHQGNLVLKDLTSPVDGSNTGLDSGVEEKNRDVNNSD